MIGSKKDLIQYRLRRAKKPLMMLIYWPTMANGILLSTDYIIQRIML